MSVKMPEPVAWISTVQCIGAKDYGKDHYGKLPVQSLQQGYYSHTPLITIEQAEAYAQAVRDEALDKAADLVGGSSMTSRHAAAAIRALEE